MTYMIRDCAADSGGTNYDSEIGGMSHCGVLMREIQYNGQNMNGCIMTCKSNGCNHARSNHASLSTILFSWSVVVYGVAYSSHG